MGEYINRAAAVGILEAASRNSDCECVKKALGRVKKRLEAMPAADVAPMVRCGKCIHRDPEDKKCDCGCWHIPFTVKDEDFCSYGERKNDADEPDRA